MFKMKKILPVVMLVSFFVFGLGTSQADEVTITGHTLGSLFSATGTTTYQGLTYTEAIPFVAETVGGTGSVNLGTLTLVPTDDTYGGTFELMLTFVIPSGIGGG